SARCSPTARRRGRGWWPASCARWHPSRPRREPARSCAWTCRPVRLGSGGRTARPAGTGSPYFRVIGAAGGPGSVMGRLHGGAVVGRPLTVVFARAGGAGGAGGVTAGPRSGEQERGGEVTRGCGGRAACRAAHRIPRRMVVIVRQRRKARVIGG